MECKFYLNDNCIGTACGDEAVGHLTEMLFEMASLLGATAYVMDADENIVSEMED